MELSKNTIDLLQKIEEKFEKDQQKIDSYLEGLLHQRYLDYWDYIELDTLLSLQKPRTEIADENIFIIYHQITELYFKLILNEINQILAENKTNLKLFNMRITRICNYFEHLANSFSIMKEGMSKEQFLEFRMALLPASGFQSAQYRIIEFRTTSIQNLLHIDYRGQFDKEENLDILYPKIYWKYGAIDKDTGNKALTLKRFENHYDMKFLEEIRKHHHNNINDILITSKEIQNDEESIRLLRRFDYLSNVIWPNAHVMTAGRYLGKGQDAIGATGGTNWQEYLPPRHQHRRFFPSLWSIEEIAIWGSLEIKI